MLRIRRAILDDDADALARVMIESNHFAVRGLVPDQCLAWITRPESIYRWDDLAPLLGRGDATDTEA